MDITIAAVIVTFNRKELLLKNIEMCFSQQREIDKIIIIDNHSEDGTRTYIFNKISKANLDKIDYVYLEKNIGGAGGFSYGVKYAMERTYDYIWLMDDDGYPFNNMTLQNLVYFLEKQELLKKPVWLNSLVCCNDTDLSFGIFINNHIVSKRASIDVEFVMNTANPFNGTLLSKELVKTIGLPREDYFIKGDEKEYLSRAQKEHTDIYTICNSLYYHPTPRRENGSFSIFGKKIENSVEAGWKEYYNVRNTCLNNQLYSDSWLYNSVRFYLGRVLKILIYSNKKIETLKLCTIGFAHAILKKTGVIYLPGNKKAV